MKNLISFVLVVAVGLWGLTGCKKGEPAVTILNVRIEDYDRRDGQPTQMAHVDWKNTGTAPAYEVTADITLYNAAGQVVATANRQRVSSPQDAVQPGQTYAGTRGNGYYYIPKSSSDRAVRGTAEIVRIGKSPTIYLP